MASLADRVSILTYHSISNEPGPTSIPPDLFRAQMENVAELGVKVVSLRAVEQWINGDLTLEGRTIAITFDDAFRNFAEAAHPVLHRLGFSATVFAPTALIGGVENWRGANRPGRTLLDWRELETLSRQGVTFGSHSRNHRDLTTLNAVELESELADSRRDLEDRLGEPAAHFAPPYGRVNRRVVDAIARHYSLSVGVRLGDARRSATVCDLPRIEMHYYRDRGRWRSFLNGEGTAYFQARRMARGTRNAIAGVARALPRQVRS